MLKSVALLPLSVARHGEGVVRIKPTNRGDGGRRRRFSAFSRWSFLVLSFLALGIQGLVVKPHVHDQAAGVHAAALVTEGDFVVAASAVEGGPQLPVNPSDYDLAECPLCQTAHHAGQFLRPTTASIALPHDVNFSPIAIALKPVAIAADAFSWQGRAPPQA
jgi:hypothetical protein